MTDNDCCCEGSQNNLIPKGICTPIQKNPHLKVGIKEGKVPSGLSGAGLVFGVFDLKPFVAYTKANLFGGKCGNERSV